MADELYAYQPNLHPRWANAENRAGARGAGGMAGYGRKGAARHDWFKPGETLVLAEAAGSGVVRRIWITLRQRPAAYLRGLTLEIFWDGCERPAVQAPLGDFCCQPHGRYARFENAFFSNPTGSSFNCILPMPFREGMRVQVVNETGLTIQKFFYEVDYTLGDAHDVDMLYFHACYRRENPTALRQDFRILPRVHGHGRFLGCSIGIIQYRERYPPDSWWGEGEVKMFLDGDRDYPTLCGTGTEDYPGTGWGMELFHHREQGVTICDAARGEYAFYRFHLPDPIFFHQDIEVTMQTLGGATRQPLLVHMERHGINEYLRWGDGSEVITIDDIRHHRKCARDDWGWWEFERQEDVCAVAYFYLDNPMNDLPAIDDITRRMAGIHGLAEAQDEQPPYGAKNSLARDNAEDTPGNFTPAQ